MSRTPGSAGAIARSLEEHGLDGARVAVVLGSGLGGFARRLEEPREIAFAQVEGMPRSAVPGHAGRFVVGRLGGQRVLVQEGRVHLYEGWTIRDVCAPVRALAELGVRALLLTNASGSLRRAWQPPILMRITDHIDRQGADPLGRGEGGRASPYDPALGALLDLSAADAGVALERGVYAGLLGPAYETPAEVRMLAWMGADAVGMSTVGEAQAARSAGMRVAAITCVTNPAAGLGGRPLSHADVLRAGARASDRIAELLSRALPRMADALA